MTQPPTMTTTLLEGTSQLIALLERHRGALPFADEELALHQTLRHALDEHHRRGECALGAWREALSRRWECEIHAQRDYSAALRQLNDYYGDDPAYGRLVAPAHPDSPSTASDLLADIRRLEASVALLSQRPPFAAEIMARLRVVGDDLAAAIDQTLRCEAERRSILLDQRIAANHYRRACEKTRRLLDSHTNSAPEALTS